MAVPGSSNQRERWLATALLDIEPRLRRVRGRHNLPQLIAALRRELKIKEKPNRMEDAALSHEEAVDTFN